MRIDDVTPVTAQKLELVLHESQFLGLRRARFPINW